MATGGGSSEVTLTVRFENQRVAIRVSKDDKVSAVIQKAADALKEPPGGLSILYRGLEIPDDATVQVGGVACKLAGAVLIQQAHPCRMSLLCMPLLN